MASPKPPCLFRLAKFRAPLVLLMFSPLPLAAQDAPPVPANEEVRQQADDKKRPDQAREAARRKRQDRQAKPSTASKNDQETEPPTRGGESSQPDRNRRPNRGQPNPSGSDRGATNPATNDSAPGTPGRPPRTERPDDTANDKKTRGQAGGSTRPNSSSPPAGPPSRPRATESPDATPPTLRPAASPGTASPGSASTRENGRATRDRRANESNNEDKPNEDKPGVRPGSRPSGNAPAGPGDKETRPGRGNQTPPLPGKPDADDAKPAPAPANPQGPGSAAPIPPVPLPNPPVPSPSDPTPPVPTPPAPTPPDPTPPAPLPNPPTPTPPTPTPPAPTPPVPTPPVPTPEVEVPAKPAAPGTPPADGTQLPRARRGDNKAPDRPGRPDAAPPGAPAGENGDDVRKPGEPPANPGGQPNRPAAVPPGDPRPLRPERGDRAQRDPSGRPGEAVPARPAEIVEIPEVRQAETEVQETTRKIEQDLRRMEIKGPEQAEGIINQILGAESAISRAEVVREERVRPRLDSTRSRRGREAYSVAPPAQRTEAVQYFQRRLRGEAIDAPPPAFFQHYDSYREHDGHRDAHDRRHPGGPASREGRDRDTITETHTETHSETIIEHHRPRYLREGRRYVHYQSREEIPAILLAGEALNRVEIQPAQELTGYYQTSSSTSQDAPPAPETYRAETSVVVSYPVNEKSMITSDDILFQQGTTQFADPFSYEIVAALADAIKEMPGDVRFAIEGHASGEGSYESNMILSQQRAERIVREMVRGGVAPNRLLPVGYGESEARQPADAPEPLRMKDRRVVVFRMDAQVAQR